MDVDVDPKEQFLRRRLDMDTGKVLKETAREIINSSKNAVDKAVFLCDEEFKKFSGEPMIEETGLWTTLNRKESLRLNLSETLLNLPHRARFFRRLRYALRPRKGFS